MGLQQQPPSSPLPSQSIVKHFELRCNDPATPNIFLSRVCNVATVKLAIAAWPAHSVFEHLATGLKLPHLQSLTVLVAASQTRDYPMELETLSEHYIQNLHPLFKYVTIKQEQSDYAEEGDDVDWNKYDFRMMYAIHESVEVKSSM